MSLTVVSFGAAVRVGGEHDHDGKRGFVLLAVEPSRRCSHDVRPGTRRGRWPGSPNVCGPCARRAPQACQSRDVAWPRLVRVRSPIPRRATGHEPTGPAGCRQRRKDTMKLYRVTGIAKSDEGTARFYTHPLASGISTRQQQIASSRNWRARARSTWTCKPTSRRKTRG